MHNIEFFVDIQYDDILQLIIYFLLFIIISFIYDAFIFIWQIIDTDLCIYIYFPPTSNCSNIFIQYYYTYSYCDGAMANA